MFLFLNYVLKFNCPQTRYNAVDSHFSIDTMSYRIMFVYVADLLSSMLVGFAATLAAFVCDKPLIVARLRIFPDDYLIMNSFSKRENFTFT